MVLYVNSISIKWEGGAEISTLSEAFFHAKRRWLDGITNSMDEQALGDGKVREAWLAAIHGVAKSQT